MLIINIYGYARVSSKKQNEQRQIEAINTFVNKEGYELRQIYTDKLSGKDFNRPQWIKLKEHSLRKGDVLIIKELDRLGRNKNQVKMTLEELKNMGVRTMILDIPTTLMKLPDEFSSEWVFDMINNILIEVMASVAESERIKIRQRQKEGIDNAKANDVKFGRPNVEFPQGWHVQYDLWKNKEISAVECMKRLNIKKTSFYKLVKLHKNN